MEAKQILDTMKLKIEVMDTVARVTPIGCCGSSITMAQHVVKSIGIYNDTFGRKILIHELSNGDFVSEKQITLVRKADARKSN